MARIARYTIRQDRNGKFYVYDLDGKVEDMPMPTRKAARAKTSELNANERQAPPPPQAA